MTMRKDVRGSGGKAGVEANQERTGPGKVTLTERIEWGPASTAHEAAQGLALRAHIVVLILIAGCHPAHCGVPSSAGRRAVLPPTANPPVKGGPMSNALIDQGRARRYRSRRPSQGGCDPDPGP